MQFSFLEREQFTFRAAVLRCVIMINPGFAFACQKTRDFSNFCRFPVSFISMVILRCSFCHGFDIQTFLANLLFSPTLIGGRFFFMGVGGRGELKHRSGSSS